MNVGYQQHLQPDDFVLELQFALFQAPNGKLIGKTVAHKTRERGVEIAVLFLESNDTVPDRFN